MKIYDSIPRTGEVDLRAIPPEEVMSFFDTTIKEEDWLLHGGPNHYLYLEPQLAHDLYREEGCRTAIYATQISAQALYRATLNRRLRQAVSVFCREINRTASPGELPLPPQTAGFKRPPHPTIPTTFTEVYQYVQVRHRQLMLGAVAVKLSRQMKKPLHKTMTLTVVPRD